MTKHALNRTPDNPEGASRPIGLISAIALIVANMIGTGLFTTSGFLLADLKSPWLVLAAWAVGGVIATLGALSYGALARRIPESGGEYLFLSRTIHPAAGYLAGWISLLVGFSAPLAAAAFAFGEYTKTWFPAWPAKAIGTFVLLAVCALHAFDVRRGAWAQNLAVLVKVGALAIFGWLAFGRLPAPPSISLSGLDIPDFMVALVWVSFSYSGWNAAIYVAGEVRDPERNLPRSLCIGTVLVTFIYLFINLVFLLSAPQNALAGQLEIGRVAAGSLGGPLWAEATTALVALALITSISAMAMAGPRVYARMALDGYFPRWLAPGGGPPRAAITFQGVVALALLWTTTYESLLTYIGFTLGLSTACTVLGLMLWRRREGPQFPVPGWPWVPGLFISAVLCITVVTAARRPWESVAGGMTLALGWIAWRWQYRGRRAVDHPPNQSESKDQ